MNNDNEVKNQIINIIAKLDNGSHSSNQLQGVDEALLEVLHKREREVREKTVEKCLEVIRSFATSGGMIHANVATDIIKRLESLT